METPCKKTCVVSNGICVGCLRTVYEVTNWTKFTDEERREVMERLKALK